MSLTVLLALILILAELFSFVVIGIQYSNIAQSTFQSKSSVSLIASLRQDAPQSGSASLKGALATLAYYEYNASLRKGNLIQNTAQYLQYLMTNAMLPNVAAGSVAANYLKRSMYNLTFTAYNALLVSNYSGAGLQSVTENGLRITQQSPYSINVSYTENVNISTGGLASLYSLPISFSVPINNTPDLFYDQQGILRYMHFVNPSNLTSLVAGTFASSGNSLTYAYGTVYYSSGTSCPSLTASTESNIILVMPNIGSLSGCENSFMGFITNSITSISPTVPYLVYSQNVILSNYFVSGQSVLLYGPQLSTLNIENLRQAISNGYYIASPFLPSYLSRVNDSFNASVAGVSTFQGYNRQAAGFNGANSLESIPNSNLLDGITNSKATVSAWIRTTHPDGMIFSTWDGTYGYQVFDSATTGVAAIWANSGGTLASSKVIDDGAWHNVIATWNGLDVTLYVDGAKVLGPASSTFSASGKDNQIGAQCSGAGSTACNLWFNGQISGIQVYNTSLTANQVAQLYARGIEGLPMPNNGLVGWWPLNGNPNDYSGQGNTGTPSNVIYVSSTGNYLRDSLMQNYTGQTYPMPGIQSCTSMSTCSSNSLPNLFLSNLPFEPGSLSQVGSFNGQSSNISTGTSHLPTSPLTISAWVHPANIMQSSFGGGIGGTLLESNENGGSSGYVLGIKSTGVLWWWPSASNDKVSTGTVPLNTWTYITVAYNGVDVNMYLNGKLDSSQSAVTPQVPTFMKIGSKSWITGFFNGTMADVQLYNVALTGPQVSSLYNAGISGAPIASLAGNVVGWWPLNGNANDSGSYGNNGIPTNVLYPYFSGNYLAPGSPGGVENEWQALGFGSPP